MYINTVLRLFQAKSSSVIFISVIIPIIIKSIPTPTKPIEYKLLVKGNYKSYMRETGRPVRTRIKEQEGYNQLQ